MNIYIYIYVYMFLCITLSANNNSTLNASLSNVGIEIKDDSYTEFTGAFSTATIIKKKFNGENAWSMTPTNGFPNQQATTYFVDCVALFNGSILTTSWIGASSSYKIKRSVFFLTKKDIEELNDNECLNKLLLLKPCKYRYIDDNKNFDALQKVYGFIAEEVKQVLPEAVDDITDQLIPHIYKLGTVENDILSIQKDLEIQIEYTIYLNGGEDLENATKEEIIAVEKTEDCTSRIPKTYEGLKDVFAYGKIEKNFNSLKKE